MPPATHVDRVASYFHDPTAYLSRAYNLRIRSETILEMVGDRTFENILDIGCGDGSLSRPLLRPQTHLTLLDITESMLEIARSNIPESFQANVTAIHGDVMAVDLRPEDFDLVLCMGVLAHVESPEAVIERISSLLKPGGLLIVTVSSGPHIMGRLRQVYLGLKGLITRPQHRAKFLSTRKVLDQFAQLGLRLQSQFRYNFPAPLIEKMISNDRHYAGIRRRHGHVSKNTMAWLGSECIFALQKPPVSQDGATDRP